MEYQAKIKRDWPLVGILLVAAVMRLALLSIKPPHFDEGVNGWFVDQMTRTGFYHYDPTNYHGPFHFYVLFLAQRLLGRHIWALRLPLALASLAAVWFTTRFDRFIGRGAALWAAAAMAVSPACIFYGRYAIHEYWLVLSLMTLAWGLMGLWKYGGDQYLWACWVGVTGAVLTKETWVIHFGCGLLTLPCAIGLGHLSQARAGDEFADQKWTLRNMAEGALLLAGCVIFFYSGGFMDWPGLKGLYETFDAWFKTGEAGNGHEKSCLYWLELMGRYEWPSAIGFVVAVLVVLPGTPRLVRALGIYGCGATAAYSIIHYKTPWCIVSLTWPFLLLFGYGMDYAWSRLGKPIAACGAVLLLANLGYAVSLNFYQYTNPREKYVYVQTYSDVNLLMDPLLDMVRRDRTNLSLKGQILLSSYHPLPWLLGDFTNIGYYSALNDRPPQMDADFLLVEPSRVDDVEHDLRQPYFTWPLRLRDAQDESTLYLNAKTFAPIFPGRKPDFTPQPAASPTPVATPAAVTP